MDDDGRAAGDLSLMDSRRGLFQNDGRGVFAGVGQRRGDERRRRLADRFAALLDAYPACAAAPNQTGRPVGRQWLRREPRQQRRELRLIARAVAPLNPPDGPGHGSHLPQAAPPRGQERRGVCLGSQGRGDPVHVGAFLWPRDVVRWHEHWVWAGGAPDRLGPDPLHVAHDFAYAFTARMRQVVEERLGQVSEAAHDALATALVGEGVQPLDVDLIRVGSCCDGRYGYVASATQGDEVVDVEVLAAAVAQEHDVADGLVAFLGRREQAGGRFDGGGDPRAAARLDADHLRPQVVPPGDGRQGRDDARLAGEGDDADAVGVAKGRPQGKHRLLREGEFAGGLVGLVHRPAGVHDEDHVERRPFASAAADGQEVFEGRVGVAAGGKGGVAAQDEQPEAAVGDAAREAAGGPPAERPGRDVVEDDDRDAGEVDSRRGGDRSQRGACGGVRGENIGERSGPIRATHVENLLRPADAHGARRPVVLGTDVAGCPDLGIVVVEAGGQGGVLEE